MFTEEATATGTVLSMASRRCALQRLRYTRRPRAQGIASSLSCVEIFVALYYGGVLAFDAAQPGWEGRDRLIISKGTAQYPSIRFWRTWLL